MGMRRSIYSLVGQGVSKGANGYMGLGPSLCTQAGPEVPGTAGRSGRWRFRAKVRAGSGLSRELALGTPCARACTVPTGPPCTRAQLTPCALASQDGRLRLDLRLPFISFDPKPIYFVPRAMFRVSKV